MNKFVYQWDPNTKKLKSMTYNEDLKKVVEDINEEVAPPGMFILRKMSQKRLELHLRDDIQKEIETQIRLFVSAYMEKYGLQGYKILEFR